MNEPTWTAAAERERLRRHFITIALVIVVGIGIVGATQGYEVYRTQIALHDSIAAAAEARADSALYVADAEQARADSMAVANVALAARLAVLATARRADSVQAARHRREDVERLQRASEAASTAHTELVGHLDEVGREILARYDAGRDSVDAAKDREIVRLATELSSTRAELMAAHERVAGLEVEIGQLRATVTSLRADDAELREALAAKDAAIDVRDQAIRHAGRENAVLRLVGAGLLVKIGYDVLTGGGA